MNRLVKLAVALFGVWKPPFWLSFLFVQLKNFCQFTVNKCKGAYQKSRARFFGIIGVILLLVAAGGTGYYWWQTRPQPVRLSVNAGDIPATSLHRYAKPAVLKIRFGGSAAPLENVGKEVGQGIAMSPHQEGKWTWTADDELQFQVVGDWPVGESLKISLDKKLFPTHVHLEKYDLEVKTAPFKLWSQNIEFYQHPKRPKEKKVVATFRFSHPVDPKSFESHLKAIIKTVPSDGHREIKESSKKVTVTYDDFFGEAYIHSENLDIPKEKSRFVLTVQSGVKSSRGGSETQTDVSDDVEVPSMYDYFKIDEASLLLVRNDDYEPEQVLAVDTSDRVDESSLRDHLKVYLLPKDHEISKGGHKRVVRDYPWSTGEVTKSILEKSELLTLKQIPQPKDFNSSTSFKYTVDPKRSLYIWVSKGLKSFGGYELAKDFTQAQRVPEFPKELTIMSQGSLLSLSGQQKISIVGRDLRHVRFSAHRVLPSQLAHLITQSSGSFSDIDFENYNFDIENISESISKIESLPNIGRGKSQYTHFDFSSVMKQQGRNPKGLFLFEATSWNRENDYAESPSTKRLILLTDLGVILKKTVPGERLVFVQSIRSGRPVAGAEVKVMGKNGLPVVSGFTDENGQVRFKSLDDFRREKSPIAVTVETSSDFSFMPLNSKVPQLNFSKFDVGGVYSRFRESSLQAYLFSDRGIYRPGDEIRSGFIVKDSDWRKSQAQTIVEVQVRNPKGSIVKKERLKLTDVGLQEFKMKTSEVWPTGPYSIGLYLVQSEDRRMHLGSLTVKVEEFLPDRMKITARFSKTPNKGWLKPDQLKGSVLLQNLFGTPAQNRKVRTEISLSPSYPAFRSLKEYQFFDPLRSKRSYQEELAETTTNDKGEVVVDLGLDKYESASYHLNFIAEGFEAEGGRSVIASTSTLISPLDYLIGYKPEGSLNYLSKGSEMGVAVVAVDPDLKRLAVKGLKLRRIQYKPISALIKQGNGTYKYESVEKEVKLSEEDWTVADKESRLSLDTKEPGDYAYIILNEKGMELNRVRYSVMGAGNLSMDLEKNAELQVKLDKADYNPGDLVEVNIRAPYKGAGLITIERDDVYAYKWFQTDSSSSVQTIRIPKGLEGNGYVNVTFTRSLNSQEIFMSPLSVGVAPFSINKSSRINKIELKVPELIRPGSQIDIGYQSARIGKVVLFAIDQGILSVAKYQTPDPLSHFYKKKALEVTTQQILDLLLPEFELLEKRRSSQAGGAEALLGKNLNPFKRKQEKPVALWSGVKEIGPQLKNWKVTIPDYFSGQVKVIAVAVGHQSMDAHSESALVKGHFVISPNVPLMLAPGDRAIVSANVSNNVKDSGDSPEVTVRLSSSKGLLVKGEKEFKVKIAENSEKTVTFEVEAQEFLGNVDLKWETQWQDKLTERKSSLSLRPSSVYRSSIQSGVVKSQKQAEVATPRRLYSSLSKQQMQMSRLPIAVAFGLHNFLKTYPHGCTEQIVSQGFPGLLFSKNPEFGVSQKEALKSYRQLLGELRSREMPEGGVSVWPGSDIHGFFQSTYAAHYLTEAKDLGYVEGLSFLDSSLLNYLREYAERETKNLQMARVQAYAAYILTRNEKLATKALANLEEWFSGYKDDKWVSDITLLYMASAYQLMQAKDKANALLKRYQRSKDFLIDYELGVYDSNIHKLMSLFLFIKHFPERKDLYSEEDLIEIAESLGKNYNTRSAALASLAFVTYAERQKDLALLKDVKVTERSQNKTVATLRIPEKLFSAVAFSGNNEQLVLDNMGKSPIFYSQEQSGFSLPKTEPPKNQSIEVFREFLDTQGKPIEKVKVGEEVTVKLQLRSVDDKGHFNIAVVDLLPGGFEAVLDSIDRKWSSAEYVDIREDRVVLYMNSYPDVRSFTYKVKSVSRGQFVVPGIYATSMYDREVYSLGKESQIEVIP